MEFITYCLDNLNYWTIGLLMMLESTIFPIPSELVVPPAAYKAAAGGGLNIYLVILVSTLGADLGACINYFVSLYVGRPLVYRFADSRIGHIFLLNGEKIGRAERFFQANGSTATLIGRLVPVIRHLISIPAGLSRMSFPRFLLFTTIGAGLWNCILAALGWYLQTIVPYDQLNTKLEEYGHELKIVMALLFLGFIAALVIKKYRKK